MSWVSDLAAIVRGLQRVNRAFLCHRQDELRCFWSNSSLRPIARSICDQVEDVISNIVLRQSSSSCCAKYSVSSKPPSDGHESQKPTSPSNSESSGASAASNHGSTRTSVHGPPITRTFHTLAMNKSYFHIQQQRRLKGSLATDGSTLLTETSKSVTSSDPTCKDNEIDVQMNSASSSDSDTSQLQKNAKKHIASGLSRRSRERKVPGTRVERLVSFGSLGAGLAVGAVAEAAKRGLGLANISDAKNAILDKNLLLTEANANRIVDTLCKVRGAALKVGQMLSIQDSSLMSPELQSLFERVRQSADFMPEWQMEKVLTKDLGADWKNKFCSFNSKPFAAASIGQVHYASLHDGRQVAVKIQYPGVADSINSDIKNLVSLLKVWEILPKGLYADKALKVARKELAWECDYIREATCCEKFRNLLRDDETFCVPEVIWDLTTKHVLTTDLVHGETLDKMESSDQATRNLIAGNVLRLCLSEVFIYRFMQTDPNWSNFLFNSDNRRIMLLDFGASREYSRKFTDVYIQLIKAAAEGNRQGVRDCSHTLGFLTGYESKTMLQAHVDAVMILGEAFACDEIFDFGQQSTASRIHELLPVMLKHRLTPPPEETYSLHRKMAGCFLLCTKLRAQINCKPMFDSVWEQHLQCREMAPTSSTTTT